jgi:hypothetical protein
MEGGVKKKKGKEGVRERGTGKTRLKEVCNW